MPQEDSHPQGPERREAEQTDSRAINDQHALEESKQPKVAQGVSSLNTAEAGAQSPPMGKPLQPEKSYTVETRQGSADDVGRDDVGRNDLREAPIQSTSSVRRRQESGGRQDNSQENPSRGNGPRDLASQHNRPGSPPSSPGNWKTLLLISAISIVCGAAGAWAMSEFIGPSNGGGDKNSSDQKTKAQSGDSGSPRTGKQKAGGKKQGSDKEDKSTNQGGASASDIPGFTSADDAETLKKQIKHLADRLEQMDRRLDQIQKPETDTPPVVHTLQTQIAELSKEVDQVANLPAQFRRMEHRLSAVEQEFKTLRDELSADDPRDETSAAPQKLEAARDSLDASQSSAIPKSSDSERSRENVSSQFSSEGNDSEPAIDESAGDDATMKLGTALFQQGKYVQARDVFRRLQRARPHDARVWYYSALANGLITHVWDGKTERLFDRGRERELAGDPPSEQIDAAFADLKPPEAKQRLDDYRGRIQEHSSLQREPDQIENERPAAKPGSG